MDSPSLIQPPVPLLVAVGDVGSGLFFFSAVAGRDFVLHIAMGASACLGYQHDTETSVV